MRRPDPLSSLVLTVPVFLIYHLGILLIDFRNGVDLVTGVTFQLLESSVLAYIGVTVGLAALLFVGVWVQHRRGRVRAPALGNVLLESALWAVVMLVSVGWATAQLQAALSHHSFALSLAPAFGPLDKLVMAAGAGFHEEVIFRVLLLSGMRSVLMRTGFAELGALVVALLASSVLFALAHHLGPVADPIELTTLTFRTIAGVYLGAVYLLRGFAVVVYTHTLYDVLVFFLF